MDQRKWARNALRMVYRENPAIRAFSVALVNRLNTIRETALTTDELARALRLAYATNEEIHLISERFNGAVQHFRDAGGKIEATNTLCANSAVSPIGEMRRDDGD